MKRFRLGGLSALVGLGIGFGLFACGDGSAPARSTFPVQDIERYSGTWAGPGTIRATDRNGPRQGTCPQVQLTLRMRADSLHLESLTLHCDFFWSSYGPLDAEIRGQEIWMNGDKIGRIDGDGIVVDVSRKPAWAEHFEFRIGVDGNARLVHHRSEDDGTSASTLDHAADLKFQPQ